MSDDGFTEQQFEHYVQVLELLELRVSEAVLGDQPVDDGVLSDAEWEQLRDAIGDVVKQAHAEGLVPEFLDVVALAIDLLYECTGLGPIEFFLGDADATALFINGSSNIYVSQGGEQRRMFKAFSSDVAFQRIVDKLITMQGYGLDDRPALVQGEIAGGTWYEMVLPPLTSGPAALSLVKRSSVTAPSASVESLGSHLADGASVLVTGSDDNARTAIVNALASLLPANQRVVVVEGTPGCAIANANAVWLRAPTLREEREQLIAMLPSLYADCIVANGLSGFDTAGLTELSLGGATGLIATAYGSSAVDALDRIAVQGAASGNVGVASALGAGFDWVVHVDGSDADLNVTISSVSLGSEGIGFELSD